MKIKKFILTLALFFMVGGFFGGTAFAGQTGSKPTTTTGGSDAAPSPSTAPVAAATAAVPDSDPPYKKLVKCLLLGDSGGGKSQLLCRMVNDSFDESPICTIGVDFKTLFINSDIKLQIWDTAGCERFRAITSAYYRGTEICFIMVDLTDYNEFKNAKHWFDDVKDKAPGCKVIIVGTKKDLKERRVVEREEIERFAKERNLPYVETSAKTGEGVDELMRMVNLIVDPTSSVALPAPSVTDAAPSTSASTSASIIEEFDETRRRIIQFNSQLKSASASASVGISSFKIPVILKHLNGTTAGTEIEIEPGAAFRDLKNAIYLAFGIPVDCRAFLFSVNRQHIIERDYSKPLKELGIEAGSEMFVDNPSAFLPHCLCSSCTEYSRKKYSKLSGFKDSQIVCGLCQKSYDGRCLSHNPVQIADIPSIRRQNCPACCFHCCVECMKKLEICPNCSHVLRDTTAERCGICFEDYSRTKHRRNCVMCLFHWCEECMKRLTKCPQCRAAIADSSR